jgi:pimeloyl-ACP methyl ester carboxylesterase
MSMNCQDHLKLSDLHSAGKIAADVTKGITAIVEELHTAIIQGPGLNTLTLGPIQGITWLVYRTINGATTVTGGGIDAVLSKLVDMLGREAPLSFCREALIAAANGVVGDYLEATQNPLAIPMQFRLDARPLMLDAGSLAGTLPRVGGKLLVMVHGLCMNDLQWKRNGHDHGIALSCDLGYTPVYLHYNSGRHVSENGRQFADLMASLTAAWPVPIEEITIIGHSMGGLVARSALHYGNAAGQDWMHHINHIVFLASPHHGAPLERGGNILNAIVGITPYTRPFVRLGNIRSAGITDLRYGSILDQDWMGRNRFDHSGDLRQPVPLPDTAACYAVAATLGKKSDDIQSLCMADGLVPINSALGCHKDPARCLSIPDHRTWVGYEMGHLDTLHHPDVYARIKNWLASV